MRITFINKNDSGFCKHVGENKRFLSDQNISKQTSNLVKRSQSSLKHIHKFLGY